jgi:hypothetical protein
MSWSVSATGKASAVRTEIKRQFETGSKCIEPEETVRLAAASLLDAAIAAQDPSKAVKISAGGSQNFDHSKNSVVSNNLNIVVEPIYGFVE